MIGFKPIEVMTRLRGKNKLPRLFQVATTRFGPGEISKFGMVRTERALSEIGGTHIENLGTRPWPVLPWRAFSHLPGKKCLAVFKHWLAFAAKSDGKVEGA
jgi:hypothetical protein